LGAVPLWGSGFPIWHNVAEAKAYPHAKFYLDASNRLAAWIKMPFGMEVGLGSGDFVLDGNPAPSPKRGRSPQIFGPCLLWPKGWMNQDGTWHGGRPQPRRLYVRWWPSSPPQKGGGAPSPIFSPYR